MQSEHAVGIRRWRRIGLGWKFSILNALLVATLLTLYSLQEIYTSVELERAELLEKGDILGQFISLVSPESILSYDFFSLNDYMKQANSSPDVVYAVIFRDDKNLTTFLDRNKPLVKHLVVNHGDLNITEIIESLQTNKTIHQLSFFINDAGISLGRLEIGLSLQSVEDRKNSEISSALIKGFFLVAMLSLVSFFSFRFYALMPIRNILVAIGQGKEGNLQSRIPILAEDELGMVSHALNHMMEEIQKGQKMIKASENRFRLIMNSGAEGIIGTDREGKCTFVNQAAIDLLASPKESIIGHDLHRFIHHGSHDQVDTSIDCPIFSNTIERGEIFHDEKGLLQRIRHPIDIEYWLHPIRENDQIMGVIFTFIDITDRRLAQDELQRTLASLDETVRVRTAELYARMEELERTREELVQSEKIASLGRMVAGFSHELNSPIGIAVGSSTHIQKAVLKLHDLFENDEINEDDMQLILHEISTATELTFSNLKRCTNLISRFKRTAIDQTSDEITRFDLCQIIHNSVETFQLEQQIDNIPIFVSCESPLKFSGRRADLNQIINNLLFNSIRHAFNSGAQSGQIEITIHGTAAQTTIIYKDNGAGMNSDTVRKIFEPFYTTNRGTGESSGLGMYICYNIVTSHLKGTIHCESTLGKGSQFTLVLPMDVTI